MTEIDAGVSKTIKDAGDEVLRVERPAAFPEPERRRRERGFLFVALVALAGYLSLLIAVRSNREIRADLGTTIRLQSRQHPSLARTMSAVSWFGFRPQSLLLPGSAVAGYWLLRSRLESVFLAAAWASSLLSFFTKLLIQRPRPSNALVRVVQADIHDTSFPSGHTLHYVTFWGFFSYLVFTRLRNRLARWSLVGVTTALIGLVGPSRVYLGHHWLTDVLASYLLGLAYLIGLVTVYRRVREFLHE